MRPLIDMDTIQIEITNACVHACANCTRLVGHTRQPFFMTLEDFQRAVDSLTAYPKMVGVMGGEPLIHPRFEDICAYLRSRVPRERCGLWSTLPAGKEHLAPIIAETFGSVLLNDHTHGDIYHCPVLVSPEDMQLEEFEKWYRIDHCWVQNSWSASITPKGAFFCEIAASLDMVLQGPGGWPVEAGWWKKTPKDYHAQMERYCRICGAAFPLEARKDTDGIDDVSASMLQRLEALGSPKLRKGLFRLHSGELCKEVKPLNQFRRDNSYFEKIARRYNLGLRPNRLNYLEPYLLTQHAPCPCSRDMRAEAGAALDQGDAARAAELYAACLADAPRDVDLLFEYATSLNLIKQHEKAVELLYIALSEEPNNLPCMLLLAFCLHNQNCFEEAYHYYSKARRLGAFNLSDRSAANLFYLAGLAATETGRTDAARESFEQACSSDPEHIGARLLRATVGPCMPVNSADAEYRHRRYREELEETFRHALLDSAEGIQRAFAAVGNTTPYYLAYLGMHDRESQRLYGSFLSRVMAAKFPDQVDMRGVAAHGLSRRIRVGFVSAHFYNHSVWKIITRGWLSRLDRSRFELFSYATGAVRDAATDVACRLSDRFHTSQDIHELVAAIADDQPDILIYPGIGMDHHTQLLAALRLAPVQCAAWGHPVTTGLPTMDYFLSSQLMEPVDGDDHYTERLIRLPNLSVTYEPLDPPEQITTPPELLRLPADAVTFLCCQNLLKYQPRYDALFARIAQQVPGARFVFINFGDQLVRVFSARLAQQFSQRGLSAENHLLFVPRLDAAGYAGLNAACDIYLDSIGWSGGNTTFESLPYNKPIVTLPGEFMRGRHTSAMLQMMGVTETIAADTDDYVSIAVKLAHDSAWRQAVSARIAAFKHRLYHDDEPVRALESFIIDVCRRSSADWSP